MENSEKTFSDMLHEAIANSGKSFRELERMTGVRASTINRFCNKKRDITLAIADRIWIGVKQFYKTTSTSKS